MYDHVQSYRPFMDLNLKEITLAAFGRMDYMRAKAKAGKYCLGHYCNHQGETGG